MRPPLNPPLVWATATDLQISKSCGKKQINPLRYYEAEMSVMLSKFCHCTVSSPINDSNTASQKHDRYKYIDFIDGSITFSLHDTYVFEMIIKFSLIKPHLGVWFGKCTYFKILMMTTLGLFLLSALLFEILWEAQTPMFCEENNEPFQPFPTEYSHKLEHNHVKQLCDFGHLH